MVDLDLQPKTLLPNYSFLSRDNYIGCQSRWMGSPLPGPSGTGTLELQTSRGSFKHLGTEGCLPSSPSLQSTYQGKECLIMYRQQTGSCLYTKTRWDQKSHTHEGGASDFRMGSVVFDGSESSLCPSSPEPFDRRPEQNLHFKQ